MSVIRWVAAALSAALFLAQSPAVAAPAGAVQEAEELWHVVELAGEVFRLVDRPLSKLNACYAEDTYRFADEKSIRAYRKRKRALREEVPESELAWIWYLLASHEHIPFRYPEDGCYARAHEMARILELNGIRSRKVFLFGDLNVDTDDSPEGAVSWTYHVAPVISVRMHDDSIRDLVLDPSLMSAPASYETWQARMTVRSCPIVAPGTRPDGEDCYHYFTSRHVYAPGSEKTRKWRARDLADAEAVMREFRKVQQLRQGGRSDLGPFRAFNEP